MPRKENPQHKARKRVARARHKAQHEAGYFQRKKREVERLRKVAMKNEAQFRALTALILK